MLGGRTRKGRFKRSLPCYAHETGLRSIHHKLCVCQFHCPSIYAVAPKFPLCLYQDLKPLLRQFLSQ